MQSLLIEPHTCRVFIAPNNDDPTKITSELADRERPFSESIHYDHKGIKNNILVVHMVIFVTGITCFLLAICITATPFITDLWLLVVVVLFGGVTFGYLDAGDGNI